MEGGETVVSGVVTGVETPVSRVKSVTLKLRLYFHSYIPIHTTCNMYMYMYMYM